MSAAYTSIQKDIEALRQKRASLEKAIQDEKIIRDGEFELQIKALNERAEQAKKVNALESTLFLHTTLGRDHLMKPDVFPWPVIEIYRIYLLGKPSRIWRSFLIQFDCQKGSLTDKAIASLPNRIDDANTLARHVSTARRSYTTIETKRFQDQSRYAAKVSQLKALLNVNTNENPRQRLYCTVCGGRDKYIDFMVGEFPVCCSQYSSCKKEMHKKANKFGLYIDPGCESCDKW